MNSAEQAGFSAKAVYKATFRRRGHQFFYRTQDCSFQIEGMNCVIHYA